MKQRQTNFWNQIRWKNVVIYLLLQVLLYFIFFHQVFSFTNGWFFLVLSMLFFGMFGNLQNNLADYELDSQKPDFVPFNKTTYLILEIIFLIFGFIFGFTAFYMTFSPTVLYAILSVPLLLSLYNYFFKKWPLFGNIIIAFLTAFSIYIPIAYTKGLVFDNPVFYFLIWMAFLISLMRELVKDMEDVVFDKSFNHKTLPVLSLKVSKLVYALLILSYFYLLFLYKNDLNNFLFFILFTIGVLSLIFSIKLIKENRFQNLTQLFKLWMIIGFLSVIFLSN